MNIAKKEARGTRYWIRLIVGSGLLKHQRLFSLLQENGELIKILASPVKTTHTVNLKLHSSELID